MLRNRLDIQLRNVCLIFRVYGWLQSLWTPWTPFAPSLEPWNIQLSQGTGQGVSMTFNAASRLPSLEDRSAALGSRRCELPGMHSVPKSAVLPYPSGVGGLSRRLLNEGIHSGRQTSYEPLSKLLTLDIRYPKDLTFWDSWAFKNTNTSALWSPKTFSWRYLTR